MQKNRTSPLSKNSKWFVFLRTVNQGMRSILSSSQSKLKQAHNWLSNRSSNAKGEIFGLKDLEVSLVLILFLVQVVLPMMGVQQSFWGAILCWIVILVLSVRIVWKWESTAKFRNIHKVITSLVIVSGIFYFVCGPLTKTFYLTVRPSFIFIAPTEELVNCERRALVVKHIGARVLANVDVAVLDNDTNRGEVTKYPEIAPGEPDPIAPKLIWWKPSHPWAEDYTISSTSGDMRISQHLIILSIQKQFQLASEVSVNGKPEFSCRDLLVPSSYTLARDAKETCERMMAISRETKRTMGLESSNYQTPDLNYQVTTMRTLTASLGVEGQSESRHIWEFQKTWMATDLSKYQHARVLLLASGTGTDTWKYAEDLRDAFRIAKWDVKGPQKLPSAYDGLLDVQISRDNTVADRPEVQVVMSALTRAGIKHKTRPVLDPDIGRDMIVVFIGSRSPDAVDTDDCEGVTFTAEKMKDRPCTFIAQTTTVCPLMPADWRIYAHQK